MRHSFNLRIGFGHRCRCRPFAALPTHGVGFQPGFIQGFRRHTSTYESDSKQGFVIQQFGRPSLLVLKAASTVDWSALAKDDGVPEEEDPSVLDSFNKVCNQMVRAFLKEDLREIRNVRDELNNMGEYYATAGKRDAATFIYVLYGMTEHKLPKEAELLSGEYKAAFLKIFNMVEDSGWRLLREGEDEEDEEGEDETRVEELQESI